MQPMVVMLKLIRVAKDQVLMDKSMIIQSLQEELKSLEDSEGAIITTLETVVDLDMEGLHLKGIMEDLLEGTMEEEEALVIMVEVTELLTVEQEEVVIVIHLCVVM